MLADDLISKRSSRFRKAWTLPRQAIAEPAGEVAHRLVEGPLVELAEGLRSERWIRTGSRGQSLVELGGAQSKQAGRVEIPADQILARSRALHRLLRDLAARPAVAGPSGSSRDRAATRSKYWLSWSSMYCQARPLVGDVTVQDAERERLGVAAAVVDDPDHGSSSVVIRLLGQVAADLQVRVDAFLDPAKHLEDSKTRRTRWPGCCARSAAATRESPAVSPGRQSPWPGQQAVSPRSRRPRPAATGRSGCREAGPDSTSGTASASQSRPGSGPDDPGKRGHLPRHQQLVGCSAPDEASGPVRGSRCMPSLSLDADQQEPDVGLAHTDRSRVNDLGR